MADLISGATPSDRVREIEMRLWEEVGTQLKGVTDALKDLTREMRDVRDRIVRIEAQDHPAKIAAMADELRDLHDQIAQTKQDAAAEIAAVKQDANAQVTQAKADAAADKLALEKRLTRMEVIIAPLTVGGSAFLAAVIGALVTAFQAGLGHH